MRQWTGLLYLLLAGLGAAPAAAAEQAYPLRVLYVGNTKAPRAGRFASFLRKHFAGVTVADRTTFRPAAAHDADVVLFDWSQSEGGLKGATVPLGRLEDWLKPTVLLNHAGLLVASAWRLIGGAG
jgi:hypothetical protein